MHTNFTIEETRDDQLVWNISQGDGVREFIVNDSWEQMGDNVRRAHVKIITQNPSNHVLVVRDGYSTFGCFILDFKGNGLYEVHTMLCKSCRGMSAVIAGREAIKFAFGLQGVDSLVSYCPTSNRQSYFFARLCGFKDAGKAAWQWIKNNVAFDVRIVTLTKESFCH